MVKVALGFRAHSGWAALVVASDDSVIDRRRLELIDANIKGAAQPYHVAKPKTPADAEAFLRRCRGASQNAAAESVRELLTHLARNDYKVVGACVLLGSGRPTIDLAATLRSHAMIHTAEGNFFRHALISACEASGLPVMGATEKELLGQTASPFIAEIGKRIGPPWRQDEKVCTLAAWLALGSGFPELRLIRGRPVHARDLDVIQPQEHA